MAEWHVLRGPFESEDGVTERRRDAADGDVEQHQQPEPDQVKAERCQQRLVDRDHHQHQCDLVDEHAQDERNQHHHK